MWRLFVPGDKINRLFTFQVLIQLLPSTIQVIKLSLLKSGMIDTMYAYAPASITIRMLLSGVAAKLCEYKYSVRSCYVEG